MTDYFAILHFPRAPWLDPEAVQARFLELSAPLHPDRVHGLPEEQVANDQFAELNAAAATLIEPRDRLNHLLQLEVPETTAVPVSIAPELVDFFMRVSETSRNVDHFLSERSRVTSPVLKAQFFEKSLEWTDRISELQSLIATMREDAESELKRVNSTWPAEKPFDRLRKLAHTFAMLRRWQSHLEERFSSLAAPI